MARVFTRSAIAAGLAAIVAVGMVSPAQAQRDPAYEAARRAGQIGEQADGYLGLTGGGDAALRQMVNELNIKRRAVYLEKASASQATLEQYALTAGCLAIARTAVGEKYQTPDGTWQTRTSAPPIRDARCPQ